MFGAVLAKIFGSGEVVKQGIDLIDSFHTSDVEAIEAKTKAKIDLMEAYHPYKLAQRYLMLLIVPTYLVVFISSILLTYFGVDTTPIKSAMNEFYLGEFTGMIMAFYFGGGLVESVGRAKKGTLSGRSAQ